ncbi:hypothetical protein CH063_09912 [Colletotrichum higginsianum]|uniref:Uncharacterized protein n=1 Tax=Colletotrichum higginsianum (strain IMI 349063) TaxID=759273 RepID=H1VFF2_COLHI|nr:hypothetical protein CH63R_02223 [Colletotrichum higginsianum IMI 349063]OBR13497.1 hypothetical protein CH63R_02223 [Colletotrichum higginsianum IMI 349063]CCF38955.1 hypothetical protein CH063_09912 [Colletotrichum higginsianum]
MGGDWHFLLEEEKPAGTFHSYWQLRQFNKDRCKAQTRSLTNGRIPRLGSEAIVTLTPTFLPSRYLINPSNRRVFRKSVVVGSAAQGLQA